MKLSCIIVDDEPVARKGLAEDVATIDFIEVAGIAGNAMQALDMITKTAPDLILLDIEMPKLSGFELIKMLNRPPMVIITTAYPGYALDGYQLDVIDYLLKPVAFSRLLKACNKARELTGLKQQVKMDAGKDDNYLFIKCDGRHEKIFFSEILLIEGANNYITVHTAGKSFLTYQTLKNMQACLPQDNFIKVHKSYIAAIDKITRIDGNNIILQKYTIPLSRKYKENVAERVFNKKILKR